MTFSSDFFPFANGTPGTSVTINDGQIQNAYPGIGFSGQEGSGIYVDTREVAGSFWVAQNAKFNKTLLVWQQILTGQPSYATQYIGGQTLNWYTPALGGTLPTITWLVQMLAPQLSYQRNKQINGGVAIDQRNNGAVITPTNNQYSVDRWKAYLTSSGKFSMQRVALASNLGVPSAFALRLTSLSAFSPGASDTLGALTVYEANTIQELAWGTAIAQPAAFSVYCRVSTPGTYCISFQNQGGTRSYVTSFQVTDGNFHRYTFIIPGDTGGTWDLSDTSVGLNVNIPLATGSTFSTTNANVWQTGNFLALSGTTNLLSVNTAFMDLSSIQFETGAQVTPFEQRLFGAELSLCQRYAYAIRGTAGISPICPAFAQGATGAIAVLTLPVTMRVIPATVTPITGAVAGDFSFIQGASNLALTSFPTLGATTFNSLYLALTFASGGINTASGMLTADASAGLIFSADY